MVILLTKTEMCATMEVRGLFVDSEKLMLYSPLKWGKHSNITN